MPIAVNYGSVMNCPVDGVRGVSVIVMVMVVDDGGGDPGGGGGLFLMAVVTMMEMVAMGVMPHGLSLRAEKYREV